MTDFVPTKWQYIEFLYRNEGFIETALSLMRARPDRTVWLPEMEEFAEGLVAKPITDFTDYDIKRVLTELMNEVEDNGGDVESVLAALAERHVDKPQRVDFAYIRQWFVSLFPSEEAALQHMEGKKYPIEAERISAFFSSESGAGLYYVVLSAQHAARAPKDVVGLLHSFRQAGREVARSGQRGPFPPLMDFLRALEAVNSFCRFDLGFISTGELEGWKDELRDEIWLRDQGIEPGEWPH